MPQPLSKCQEALKESVSESTTNSQRKKRRVQKKWKRFRYQKQQKKETFTFSPEAELLLRAQQPPEPEDWEKEIKEFLCKMEEEKENELQNKTPYDPEDFTVEFEAMTPYSVPCAPSFGPEIYSPFIHHATPIKWQRHARPIEVDQFADVEE